MAVAREQLFVYGTLRDPQIRARILGPCPAPRPAKLRGYVLREDGGYYFVRPGPPQAEVDGEVLELDTDQLRRADRWEEVPTYARVRVDVDLAETGTGSVWVYERRDVVGRPVEAPGIAGLDRATILAQLAQ